MGAELRLREQGHREEYRRVTWEHQAKCLNCHFDQVSEGAGPFS